MARPRSNEQSYRAAPRNSMFSGETFFSRKKRGEKTKKIVATSSRQNFSPFIPFLSLSPFLYETRLLYFFLIDQSN